MHDDSHTPALYLFGPPKKNVCLVRREVNECDAADEAKQKGAEAPFYSDAAGYTCL